MKKRVGDTLIEVTLAVGIFSMVAIAIVAVMASGNSSAQTALETTLAREEIDSQAEALRFIHSAYIADKSNNVNDKYVKVWEKIKQYAVSSSANQNSLKNITNYTPSSCSELFNSDGTVNTLSGKGFVINARALGSFKEGEVDKVIVTGGQSSEGSQFSEASTYPRLIYGDSIDKGGYLVSADADTELYSAEGIYILAVQDQKTTTIAQNNGNLGVKQSTYYDFYIRTCWYGPGDEVPSTISTVIRLYDPDAVKYQP